MISIKTFVFSTFQVNTFVLYDETREAVIIDAGCDSPREEEALVSFLRERQLNPVLHLITHAHIDHILGSNFVFQKFGILPGMHEAGLPIVRDAAYHGSIFGINLDEIVLPKSYLKPGEMLRFGTSELQVLYTPGHADGSVCFFSRQQGFAIVGDVIFFESIGRTDLPTGDFPTLIQSIQNQIFTLDSETVLYPGHGHETTVAHEKQFNPFLQNDYFED